MVFRHRNSSVRIQPGSEPIIQDKKEFRKPLQLAQLNSRLCDGFRFSTCGCSTRVAVWCAIAAERHSRWVSKQRQSESFSSSDTTFQNPSTVYIITYIIFLAKSCEVKEDFANSTHHSRSSQRCQRGVPRPLLFVPALRKSRGISPTTAQSPPRNRREIAEDRKNRWQSKGIANVSCSLREVNLCSLRMSEVYEIHMSGTWLRTVLAAVYLSWKIHTYKKKHASSIWGFSSRNLSLCQQLPSRSWSPHLFK